MTYTDQQLRHISASEVKDRPNYSLSTLEEDLLTALLGQELYGLQISKAIEEASGGDRKIAVGSLYPSLRRLEQKGFVVSRWDANNNSDAPSGKERGGARRRYYRITASGSKVLLENRTVRENLLQWKPAGA